MSKFYKVLQDTPLFLKGAILRKDNDNENYIPISDLWNTDSVEKHLDDSAVEYDKVVENSPEWYQRVYEVTILKKAHYLSKLEARKAHEKLHKP